MTKDNLLTLLRDLRACSPAMQWVTRRDGDAASYYQECPNTAWLSWLYAKSLDAAARSKCRNAPDNSEAWAFADLAIETGESAYSASIKADVKASHACAFAESIAHDAFRAVLTWPILQGALETAWKALYPNAPSDPMPHTL